MEAFFAKFLLYTVCDGGEREREFGKTGETEEKITDFLIKKGGELAIGKQKNEIIS